MEDYIIAPELLKEMQQDGLIDQINEDIEPKPQPLPNNTILSVTKNMINNQINNKNIINNNQASLIPEVSESQENTESMSLNYNTSSLGHIKTKKNMNILKQNPDYNNINYNYIKEENDEEESNQEQINTKNNYDKDNNNFNSNNEEEEKEEDITLHKEQKSFDIASKTKKELINTSISTEEIEPLYNNINSNFIRYNLTPDHNRHLNSTTYDKNKSDIKISKKKDIKEIKKLQNELNILAKQFNKIDKSLKKKNEELKKIKILNDNLLKENNNQKKIIDEINEEKVILSSKIISLKDYCNKIETKLVSGSKNQHLIEINNKLRKENESLINQIEYYESEKKDLIKKNEILSEENNIIKSGFQSNSERNNGNNNNKNINMKLINEYTQDKKRNKKLEDDINKLKIELSNKDLIIKNKEEEIQSINYAKEQMTSIIAQKENEIHNLIIERDSFQKHYQETKDKLDDANKTSKLKLQYESVIKKYINEINGLKKENKNLNEKKDEYEIIIKEYDMVLNDKKIYGQKFDELMDKLEKEVKEQIEYKKNKVNDEDIFIKLNSEKEKSLKLINDIETLII